MDHHSYTARVFARISGAYHVIDDSSRCVFSVVLLALRIRLDLDGHLLQHIWLATTCVFFFNPISLDISLTCKSAINTLRES